MGNCGIYTITNILDKKIYVGYTINFQKREEDHFRKLRNNKHKNSHLQSAWNNHGEENFVFEILEEWNVEFLLPFEHYWCNLLNTHNRDYGYNIRPTFPFGKTLNTPEIREKISKSHMGKTPNWGKDYKKNKSLQMKQRGWTKEEIEKSAVKRRIPIICLLSNGQFFKRFESGREAAKELSINFKHISLNCNGKCNTVKGYIFLYESDYDSLKDYSIYRRKSRGVQMYDKNMNLIREFISISEAATYLGTKGRDSLKKAAENNKLYKSYIWKLKDLYREN